MCNMASCKCRKGGKPAGKGVPNWRKVVFTDFGQRLWRWNDDATCLNSTAPRRTYLRTSRISCVTRSGRRRSSAGRRRRHVDMRAHGRSLRRFVSIPSAWYVRVWRGCGSSGARKKFPSVTCRAKKWRPRKQLMRRVIWFARITVRGHVYYRFRYERNRFIVLRTHNSFFPSARRFVLLWRDKCLSGRFYRVTSSFSSVPAARSRVPRCLECAISTYVILWCTLPYHV